MRHATGAICKRLAAPNVGLVRNRPCSILSDSLRVAFCLLQVHPLEPPHQKDLSLQVISCTGPNEGAVQNGCLRLHNEHGGRWISATSWSSVVAPWQDLHGTGKANLHLGRRPDTVAIMDLLDSRHGVAFPISVGYAYGGGPAPPDLSDKPGANHLDVSCSRSAASRDLGKI